METAERTGGTAARSPGMAPLDPRGATLSDRTLDALREAVRTGQLVPGRLYSVYRVADDLGVSRSPVREALLRLAETGMIRFERNRGFRVVTPDAEDLLEVFGLRLDLEVPAAARAAARCTPELARTLARALAAMAAAAADGDESGFLAHDQHLHRAVLEAAGNRRAMTAIEDLRDATRLVGASTTGRSRTLDDVLAEHPPIVDAICAGDPAAAGAAMRDHLGRTAALLLAQAAPDDDDVQRRWRELVGSAGSADPGGAGGGAVP